MLAKQDYSEANTAKSGLIAPKGAPPLVKLREMTYSGKIQNRYPRQAASIQRHIRWHSSDCIRVHYPAMMKRDPGHFRAVHAGGSGDSATGPQ